MYFFFKTCYHFLKEKRSRNLLFLKLLVRLQRFFCSRVTIFLITKKNKFRPIMLSQNTLKRTYFHRKTTFFIEIYFKGVFKKKWKRPSQNIILALLEREMWEKKKNDGWQETEKERRENFFLGWSRILLEWTFLQEGHLEHQQIMPTSYIIKVWHNVLI